jgi:hypothetical protein
MKPGTHLPEQDWTSKLNGDSGCNPRLNWQRDQKRRHRNGKI